MTTNAPKIKLEDFARAYISAALNLAKIGLETEVFDRRLYNSVSRTTGISKEKIAKIHHPLYWVLFEEQTELKKGYPMRYAVTEPALLEIRDSRVYLNGSKNRNKKIRAINRIISEYAIYIKSKVRRFQ